MNRPSSCRALLVYPRFSPDSFWNYHETCALVGARYSAAPLGLITVAALLPPDWDVRLVDCNVEELGEDDLAWADLVLTGGMLPQQRDALNIVRAAHRRGKPAVVGGPDVTCSPDLYEEAEFRVLGEAEEVLGEFCRAWSRGMKSGVFKAGRFPDITGSPVPRFDLLKLKRYMHVGVQRSRGCPFNCEFCNVIELNGRRPRSKTTAQVLCELDTLAGLGYRGHVDFVDDNLIGDLRSVGPFLKELGVWLKARGNPFQFSTEVSINLAENPEMLALMREANFFAVFVGVETPDTETLCRTNKRQNTRADIVESIHRFYRAGMFVNAGFILGFDGERSSVGADMIRCIEDTAIPVCMVGLLYALPNTQLSRRLQAEGRLRAGSDSLPGADDSDQCSSGLNFETDRPRREILEDYRKLLASIYSPAAFFARVRKVAREIDVSGNSYSTPMRHIARDLRSLGRILWRMGVRDREAGGPFRRTLLDALLHNPAALRMVVSLAALYLHYGVFARQMDVRLRAQIEALSMPSYANPHLPAPAAYSLPVL